MDGSSYERLSGAAFSTDQYGRFGIGHAVDHVEHALHTMIVAHDVFNSEPHIELSLEIAVLFNDFTLRQCAIDGHFQFLIDQRFGQQVKRPGALCLDADLDGAVSGQQDDG